ncbi:alpha/beta-hydrolase [Gloeophyllum trabeum ATCC 11539]|uniref:Alpha/beta-hydrolase n=1 Tax=Gloeophyllum trabeum (strain ATCC 11539 / FP-39264 / Madison 617) TaxID=670483 RepID=S7RN44_GLOTA|nr:alpha/beta-hydrolase [Gloeophyllum trabeum ATCC 11539]EPQ54164.1 alpha/beta-hydrolase [Gloeophyllum trabeum ATCC 11539]
MIRTQLSSCTTSTACGRVATSLRLTWRSTRSSSLGIWTPNSCTDQGSLSVSAQTTVPVDLAYDAYGSAREKAGSLVILHGLFGSKRNWISLAKAFEKELHRPVYALDLRNHGSSPHAEPMTYSAMADDVLNFCDKHSLSNISLLGHSMGGKVAAAVALHPSLPSGLLSKLIVADIAPSRARLSSEFQAYLEAMHRIESSQLQNKKEAQDILKEIEKDPMVRAFLLTNLASDTPPLKFRIPIDILMGCIPEIGSFPYAPGERLWPGKTLFIKGTKSHYINNKNIPVAEQFFPNMKLESLDAGHWGTYFSCYPPRVRSSSSSTSFSSR